MSAFDAVRRYLEENRWNPGRIPGRSAYGMNYRGDNGDMFCFIEVNDEVDQMACYAVAPHRIPEPHRLTAAEFLTYANYGMRIGNFELDLKDGEVRYKTSIDYEGIEVVPMLIENMLHPTVSTLDRYLPGLNAIVDEGTSAKDAIALVERPSGGNS